MALPSRDSVQGCLFWCDVNPCWARWANPISSQWNWRSWPPPVIRRQWWVARPVHARQAYAICQASGKDEGYSSGPSQPKYPRQARPPGPHLGSVISINKIKKCKCDKMGKKQKIFRSSRINYTQNAWWFAYWISQTWCRLQNISNFQWQITK